MSVFKTSLLVVTSLACSNVFSAPIYFDTDKGFERLITAEYKTDFSRLANFYEAQENKLFCGVASAAIVLNALKVKKLNSSTEIPYDNTLVANYEKGYLPSKNNWQPYFHRYTQNTVLTMSPKSRIEILGKPVSETESVDYGLQLSQFSELVRSNGVNVRMVELENIDNIDNIKNDLIKELAKKDNYVVINYKRKWVEQEGGGHISPVSAYDTKSDSFLVMDVNSSKYPWSWVDADTLIKAMNTKDINDYRGYTVIYN